MSEERDEDLMRLSFLFKGTVTDEDVVKDRSDIMLEGIPTGILENAMNGLSVGLTMSICTNSDPSGFFCIRLT